MYIGLLASAIYQFVSEPHQYQADRIEKDTELDQQENQIAN
jgi:hypothetical protein